MSSKSDIRASRVSAGSGNSNPIPPQPTHSEVPVWMPRQVCDLWQAQTTFLRGKILTVIDASFSDPQQRKAVKDLVHQQFNEQDKWVYELVMGHRMLAAAGETLKP